MSHLEFSTELADYVLSLVEWNNIQHDCGIFKGIDALVVETGNEDLCRVLNLRKIPGQKKLYNYLENKKIPVYSVDEGFRSSLRNRVGNFLFQTPIPVFEWFYGNTDGEINSKAAYVHALYTFMLQTPLTEARNAIHAKKIEAMVVQELRKNPKIGLLYRPQHVGLRDNLLSARRRNFTLWNWKNAKYRDSCGIRYENLSKYSKAEFDGKSWNSQIKLHTLLY